MSVGRELHQGSVRGRIRYLAGLALQQTERRPWLWPLAGAALVGLWTVITALIATRGEPTAALDDAYIHFQFARGFARLTPLVYSPGDPPVPGATSLLWPALLAPFYAIGFRDAALLWPAWGISFLCLGLLAYETAKSAAGVLSREAAIASGAMVLAFGGLVWSAGSGMEIVPFAWLLMRGIRRLADFWEGAGAATRSAQRELVALGWLAPAMRPEGALLTLAIVVVLATRSRGRARWLALAALPGVFGPSAVNWLFTGSAASTTTEVKWLFSPAHAGTDRALATTWSNVKLFWGTLLDGEQHSALVIPRGSAPVAWLALPALLWLGFRGGRLARSTLIAGLALCILVPCTYDTFLWNRLRYLWPFAPAWFVGVGAVADLAGALLRRASPALGAGNGLAAGVFLGALLGHLPFAVQDLAESASGIQRQQVSLGRWAKHALPQGSRIGVNDTGAITYYSDRATFDIVGLTTAGQGRYWVAGPGSRFEQYERLAADRLPTHWIVYPEWHGIPRLFGDWLTERTVTDSSILGGQRMVAYVAAWSSLRSAEQPELIHGRVIDRVDVADLESEARHGYRSTAREGSDDVVYQDGARLDGGRSGRRSESFELELRPGTFVARIVSDAALTLRVSCAGRILGRLEANGSGWEELGLALPATAPWGVQRIEVAAEPRPGDGDAPSVRPESGVGPTFAALHYWLVEQPRTAAGKSR